MLSSLDESSWWLHWLTWQVGGGPKGAGVAIGEARAVEATQGRHVGGRGIAVLGLRVWYAV
jgi:hypothetical protein